MHKVLLQTIGWRRSQCSDKYFDYRATRLPYAVDFHVHLRFAGLPLNQEFHYLYNGPCLSFDSLLCKDGLQWERISYSTLGSGRIECIGYRCKTDALLTKRVVCHFRGAGLEMCNVVLAYTCGTRYRRKPVCSVSYCFLCVTISFATFFTLTCCVCFYIARFHNVTALSC